MSIHTLGCEAPDKSPVRGRDLPDTGVAAGARSGRTINHRRVDRLDAVWFSRSAGGLARSDLRARAVPPRACKRDGTSYGVPISRGRRSPASALRPNADCRSAVHQVARRRVQVSRAAPLRLTGRRASEIRCPWRRRRIGRLETQSTQASPGGESSPSRSPSPSRYPNTPDRSRPRRGRDRGESGRSRAPWTPPGCCSRA